MTVEIAERFPYKEEVTGSNPVAPTRVFRELTLENTIRTHITHTFIKVFFQNHIMEYLIAILIGYFVFKSLIDSKKNYKKDVETVKSKSEMELENQLRD